MINLSNKTYIPSEKSPLNTFCYGGASKMIKLIEHLGDKKKEQGKSIQSKGIFGSKTYSEALQETIIPINHLNYRSFHINNQKPHRRDRQTRIQNAVNDKKEIENHSEHTQKQRPYSICSTRTNQSFFISRPRNHSMLRKVIGNSQKCREFQKALKAKVFVISLTDLLRNNAEEQEKKSVKRQETQIQNGSIQINSDPLSSRQITSESKKVKQIHSQNTHKRNFLMHRNEKHNILLEPVTIEQPKLLIKGWSNIHQQATITNLQQFQN